MTESAAKSMSVTEKKIILKVYENLILDHPHLNKTKLIEKCATYTGRCTRSVSRILTEKRNTGIVNPPKVAIREEKIMLDEHQKYLVRRGVHKFFFENRLPTIDMVHAAIKENEEIPAMGRSKLYQVLKKLNFIHSKRGRKSVLIERDIRAWRRRYLREIKEIRQQNRPIFFLDETWVTSGHTKAKTWIDGSIKSARQAFNEGLKGGLLLFEGVKQGDYHDEMNAARFEEWFTKVLTLLPTNAVIVMDNASYHSRIMERWPVSSWRKQSIQEFLHSKNIVFQDNLLKVELLQLVKLHKPVRPRYVVDEMAIQQNKYVLGLPPYHCDLNSLELIWAQVKNYVASKNTTFKLSNVKLLFEVSVRRVRQENWEKAVKHIIEEEKNMWALDGFMEIAVEPLIINFNESSDDSDIFYSSDSDKEN